MALTFPSSGTYKRRQNCRASDRLTTLSARSEVCNSGASLRGAGKASWTTQNSSKAMSELKSGIPASSRDSFIPATPADSEPQPGSPEDFESHSPVAPPSNPAATSHSSTAISQLPPSFRLPTLGSFWSAIKWLLHKPSFQHWSRLPELLLVTSSITTAISSLPAAPSPFLFRTSRSGLSRNPSR